jgi:hypothetical protein
VYKQTEGWCNFSNIQGPGFTENGIKYEYISDTEVTIYSVDPSLSGEFMYRYAPRYATGLGLDLFYSSNMKELEASDRIVYGDEAVDNCPGYCPISVGISVVQEIYWRNFAVHIAIGAYPFRHKGVNGPEAKEAGDRERGWHYEKAGLRYYIPKAHNLFFGFGIKSHSIKAEYLEFSTGIRL